jgi:sec-independent protein translocase protein TatA
MIPFALIGPLGWSELLIIFFIVLIFFGPRKLPEVAEAMGKSIQKFKRASKDARREIETGFDDKTDDKDDKSDDKSENKKE